LANIKEIKRLRGGDLVVAAQANGEIDAEIGKKDPFGMETSRSKAMKVIELDQRSGEEVALAEYPDDEKGTRQAAAKVEELQKKAAKEGKDYLRYWAAD